jgi:hypothetical protein
MKKVKILGKKFRFFFSISENIWKIEGLFENIEVLESIWRFFKKNEEYKNLWRIWRFLKNMEEYMKNMKILEKIPDYFFWNFGEYLDFTRLLKFWRIFEDFWRMWRLLRNDKIF